MTPTADTKRFKLLAAKPAGRVQFDIKQEARKQELVVRLNSQVRSISASKARHPSACKAQLLVLGSVGHSVQLLPGSRGLRRQQRRLSLEHPGEWGP
ncbi:hypothetical protein BBJ28_00012103 [Nothophytophthora sp. Chile5]|nr:hypothetical protein BBJ28_00012103 [Nothophytophthora sp. Chile5]